MSFTPNPNDKIVDKVKPSNIGFTPNPTDKIVGHVDDIAPTTLTTKPVEVKAPAIPIQTKKDIEINIPLLKNMFSTPTKSENKVEQNVGTYLLGQDTNELLGNSPTERIKKPIIPLVTNNDILTPIQTYKNIAANSIGFNQNADVDLETGIDKTTGLPVQQWLQVNKNLEIEAEDRVNKLNDILYAKDIPWDSDPSKGIIGKSEQITQFNSDLYKDALVQKNQINAIPERISGIKSTIQSEKYQFNKDHKVSRLERIEQLKRLIPNLQKEYEEKSTNLDKIIQGLDATTASTSVLRPDAMATRDNPQALLDATDQDLLINAAKYTYETEAMNQPELKAGYLEKFNKEVNGKKLTDIVNSGFTPTVKGFSATPSLTQSDVESQGEKIVGDYDINTIDFQKKTLSGIETLRNNVRANIPMFDQTIKDLTKLKEDAFKDSAEKGTVLDPKYIEYIDNQIKDFTDKRAKQDVLLSRFDNIENKYFKDAKDFDIYTKTRDKDSQTLDAITDVLQPLYLGTANKVDKIPNSLESMGLAIADGLDLVSKEERVSKELKMYADNKNDALTYVPDFIKNTQAFQIKRGKDGSIKWTESLDGRAMLREGIKTTAESAMLYGTGLGIGKVTKLETILGKSDYKIAQYFADKIGILPASLVEMNDIDNQEMESYLRGDYDNINNEFSSTMRKKLIEGGTEMLWTPEAKFFKGIEQQPIKQFALKQLFTQSLGKSLVNAELKPLVKTLLDNLVFVPAEESFEELAGNVANQPFEGLQASNNLRYKAQDQLTLDNSLETVLNTTIGMIPTMLFGGGTQSYSILKNNKYNYNYELAQNPEYEKYALEALDKIPEDKLLKILPQYSSKKEAVEATLKEYDNLQTSYKESAPYSRFLPSDKEKTELFNTTLELKRLIFNNDPQLTQGELTKKAERITTLTENLNSLREKANANKQEIQEDAPKFINNNIDNFIESLDKETITPLAIEGIKAKLEQWKQTLINNPEYKESVSKIDSQLEYYNNRLQDIAKEIEEIAVKETQEEPIEEISTEATIYDNISKKLEVATPEIISDIEKEIDDYEDESLTPKELEAKKLELYDKLATRQAELEPTEEISIETSSTPQEEAPQQTPQDLIPSIRETPEVKGQDIGQTVSNDDIEAKKIDIERRRQEELKYITQDVVNDINADLGIANKYTLKTFKDKINAKYNAELEALNTQEVIQEEQKEIVSEEKLETKVEEIVKETHKEEQKRIVVNNINYNPLGTKAPYSDKFKNSPSYLRTQRALNKLRILQQKEPLGFSQKYFATVQRNLDKLTDYSSENATLTDEQFTEGIIVLLTNEEGVPFLFDDNGNLAKEGQPLHQPLTKTFDHKEEQVNYTLLKENNLDLAYDSNKARLLSLRTYLTEHPTEKFTFAIDEITPIQEKQKDSDRLKFTTKDLVSGQSQRLSQVAIFNAGKEGKQTVQRYIVNVKTPLGSIMEYNTRMPRISSTDLQQTIKDLLDLKKTEGLPENLQSLSARRELLRTFMMVTLDGEYKKYKEGKALTTPLRYFFMDNNEIKVETKKETYTLEDWYNSKDFEFLELNEFDDALSLDNFSMYNWDSSLNKFVATQPQSYKDFILSKITFEGYNVPYKDATIKLSTRLSSVKQEEPTKKVEPILPIESPIEETKPDVDEEYPSFDDAEGDSLFLNKPLTRLKSLPQKVSKKQEEKATEWFNNYMKNTGVSVKNMSYIVNNEAFANWYKGAITLYNSSTSPDLYHEAFHDFTQLYLTKDQKIALYKEISKTPQGQKVLSKLGANVTDIQKYHAIEELLAEDFRSYMLSDQKLILGQRPKRNSIFRKLFNFLKELITKQPSLETIYRNLANNNIKGTRDYTKAMFGTLNRDIPGITEQQTQQVYRAIDGLLANKFKDAGLVISNLFKDKTKLQAAYNDIQRTINATYKELIEKVKEEKNKENPDTNVIQSLNNSINNTIFILSNWNNVRLSHSESSSLLKLSKYYYKVEEKEFDEENPETRDAKYDSNDTESVREKASSQLIYLIATLPRYVYENGKQVPKPNPFLDYIQDIVEFDTMWNSVADSLKGVLDYKEQYAILEEKAKTNLSFGDLVKSLPNPNKDLTLLDLQLRNQFNIMFSQPLIPMFINNFRFQADKSLSVVANPATVSSLKKVNADWQYELQSSKNEYTIENSLGRRELDLPKVVSDFSNITNMSKETKLNFLASIGIKFSPQAEQSDDLQEFLSDRYKLKRIYDALKSLEQSRLDTTQDSKELEKALQPIYDITVSLSSPGLQTTQKELKELADIEINKGDKYFGDNRMNANGDSTWGIKQYSQQSMMYTYLNNYKSYPTYTELINSPIGAIFDISLNPDADNIFLRALFNLETGERNIDTKTNKPVQISLYDHNGLTITSAENPIEKGQNTMSLTRFMKSIQDISTLLESGEKEHLRYGDKTTSNGTKIIFKREGSVPAANPYLPVDIRDFKDTYIPQQAYSIYKTRLITALKRTNDFFIKGTLKDAVAISTNIEKGDYFGVFDGILSKTTKDILSKDIKDKALDLEALVTEHEAIIKKDINNFNKDLVDNYKEELSTNNTVSPSQYLSKYLLDSFDFDTVLKAYIVNSYILNMEHISLFFQDLRFYTNKNDFKEPFKRVAKASSTGVRMVNDSQVNNFLQGTDVELQTYNKENGTNILERDKSLPIQTAIFDDITINKESPTAKGLLEMIDIVFANAPKEELLNIQKAYIDMKPTDAMAFSTQDFYREVNIKMGNDEWSLEKESLYNKIASKEQLTQQETKDAFLFFPPLKLRIVGFTQDKEGNVIPIDYKFAISPLLSTIVKGKGYETIRDNMVRQQIGLGLFNSASKHSSIGVREGNKLGQNKLYNEDGTPNTSDYVTNPVFQDFIYEVVVSPKDYKEEVTFSTQMRKLLFLNSYEQDIPLDYKGTKPFNSLTQAEKLKQSLTYSLDNTFSNTIQALVDLEKNKLLTKIGAKLDTSTDKYTFDDAKLSSLLEDEILKRNLSKNALQSLKLVNDKFKYSLDSSLQRETLEQILLSIVDNKLRKQKGLGEALIQVSSIGYESNTLQRVDSWKDSGGWDLPYYNYEGRTLPDGTKVTSAQKIKIALQGDFKKLLRLKEVQELSTKDKITPLEALNTLLKQDTFVDKYRELISTTAVRIPVQGHNSMEFMEVYEFLPEEAGSVVIVSPALVAKSGGDFDWDKLTTLFHSFDVNPKGEVVEYKSPSEQQTQNLFKSLAKEFGLSLQQDSQDNITSDVTAKMFGVSLEELQDIILEESQKEVFSNFIAKKYYNNILNNTIRQVLERTENIQQLLTPNSTDIYEPLADERKAALSPKKGSWSDVPSPQESLNQHESNSVGKKSLGILAVANTFFSQLQKAGAYLSPNFRKDLNNPNSRPINHRLRHNKTKEGNISVSNIFDAIGQYRISENFSQLMNGAVDVAKKDWLFFINGITELIPTISYVAMTGTPALETIAFFTQPIINDFVETLKNYKSPLLKITNRRDYELAKVHAIYQTIAKYAKPGSKYFEDLKEKYQDALDTPSKAGLFYGLINKEMSAIADQYPEYFKYENFKDYSIPVKGKLKVPTTPEEKFAQVLYLIQFLEFEAQGNTLSSIRTTLNQDTTKPQNLQDSKERKLRQQEAYNHLILPKEIINKLAEESTTKAFTSPTKGIDNFINQVFSNIFDITDHPEFNQFLKEEYAKPHVTDPIKEEKQTKQLYLLDNYSNIPFNIRYDSKEEWVKTVKNDFIEYLAKNNLYLPEDPTTRVVDYFFRTLINPKKGLHLTLDYLRDTFPELYNNNTLLQYLTKDPSRTKVGGQPKYMSLKLKVDKLETTTQDILVEAFKELANFSDPNYSVENQTIIRKFAKDLAYLAFNKSGLNKSKNSFTNVIPEEFYLEDLSNILSSFKKLMDTNPGLAIKEFNNFYKLFKTFNSKFFRPNDISELYPNGEFVQDIIFDKEATSGKNYVSSKALDLLSKREQAIKLIQEKQLQHSRDISTKAIFTPDIAKDSPKTLFVYNSNTANDNKYQNMSIKLDNNTDYPNTINIPTYSSFRKDYTDKDFATIKPLIDAQIQNILSYVKQNKPTKVVFPEDILDRLNDAPSIKDYLQQQLQHYFDFSEKTPIFTSNTQVMGNNIYDKLSKTTVTPNIVISNIKTKEGKYDRDTNLAEAKANNRVYTMEVASDVNSFSNPWAHFNRTGTIKTNTTKEAVTNYIDWLTTDKFKDVKPGRRAFILDVLKSGKLKGRQLQYYAELKEPSHATALDYLINHYDWSQPITQISINTNKPSIEEDNISQEQPESTNIFDEEVVPNRQLDLFSNQEENTTPIDQKDIEGINIRSDKNRLNSLGNRLTNPNWYSKGLMDVEATYKANASKIKAKGLNAEEALKYDMDLMEKLQIQKLRKNSELIDEINEKGGLRFIQNSSHIVGVKNSRWEGKGMESNFIKVLSNSYTVVAKELGKFVDNQNNNIPQEDIDDIQNIKLPNIEIVKRYSNEDLKSNPNKLYIFGDNTQKKGTGGQATIRHNRNARGIATKFLPTMNEDAFFNDKTFSENKSDIDSDIENIFIYVENHPEITAIVFPKDGLGTGLAKLKEKAPQTYKYLKHQLLEKFGFNNDTGEILNNKTTSNISQKDIDNLPKTNCE